jgi:hypothetical protein
VRHAVEIEADDHAEAIKLAALEYFAPGLPGIEDAEEIAGYLVDEEDDDEYLNTRYYNADGQPDTLQTEAERIFESNQPPLPWL